MRARAGVRSSLLSRGGARELGAGRGKRFVTVKDLDWKCSVLEGAIAERRSKLKLFVALTAVIAVGSVAVIVVGTTMRPDLLPLVEKIGGTPAASALLACIGGTPTFRECLQQWGGLRTMEDMKRGYQRNPSPVLVDKMDKLFWRYFEQRAGSLTA